MKDIKTIIAENLTNLRKQHQLTQNELAQKLNYSDNTISRWEKAEITPSVETLEQISQLYNIPLESLFKEKIETKAPEKTKKRSFQLQKLSTILLCVSLVWFASSIAYFYIKSFMNINCWTLFVWSVPLSCLILLAFGRYVNNRIYSFVFETICIWTFLASCYLEFLEYNLIFIFLIGAPAQLAISIYTFVRPKKQK